jgi:hypothetical protein
MRRNVLSGDGAEFRGLPIDSADMSVLARGEMLGSG